MTKERREEVKRNLNLLLSESWLKSIQKAEELSCLLFLKYYLPFSILGQTGQADVLSDQMESMKKEWAKGQEKALDRYEKKVKKTFHHLAICKEEAGECLDIFLELYYKKEERQGGCPLLLAKSLAFLLCREKKVRANIHSISLFGSGSGQVPWCLGKEDPGLFFSAFEANEKKAQLFRLIDIFLSGKEAETGTKEEGLELGVSLFPFGQVKEEEQFDFFPVSCISEQKEEYQRLGTWLSKLKKQGVFYFLCPAGFLYRKGKEKNLRSFLTEETNLLDGIFLLPQKLCHGDLPGLALLRFRKDRERQETIYLLNGSDCAPDQMGMLSEFFWERKQQEGLAAHLTIEKIREQNFNLNPARYLERVKNQADRKDEIDAYSRRLEQIEQRLKEIESQKMIYGYEFGIL